jgi:hypothetical protein
VNSIGYEIAIAYQVEVIKPGGKMHSGPNSGVEGMEGFSSLK